MAILKIFEKIFDFIKKLFFTGLFTILPIAITIAILHFTFNLLAKWLKPLKNIEPLFLQKIPGAEFLVIILFLLVIGFLAHFLIVTPIIHHFEKAIKKIPLIKTIYSAAKTMVEFFSRPSPAQKAQKIVLVEFPQKDTYCLAFLFESAQDDFQNILPIPISQIHEKKFFKVFMPTAPNPTTGFFMLISEDKIIPTNITFEEALKTIVSCGLITPESLKNKK